MSNEIENVLAVLDGFRMCGQMDHSAYSSLYDMISVLDVPEWISVKDRPPEEYGNYIAVVDGEATECTYSGPFIKGIITGWSTCEADGMKWLRDEQVTHWMPLPEPPKEE